MRSNEKRTNSILIGLICLTVGLGIGFCGYYFYSNYKDNHTLKNKNSNVLVPSREVSPDSIFIKELVDNYENSDLLGTVIYNNLYAKDTVVASDLEDSYIRGLIMQKANKSLLKVNVTGKEFLEAEKELFGKKVNLVNQDFIYGNCNKFSFVDGIYLNSLISTKCAENITNSLQKKILEVKKFEDKLEVKVAVYIVDNVTGKIFNGMEELVGKNIQNFDISLEFDKVNNYVYTFSYDDTTLSYVFDNISKVK